MTDTALDVFKHRLASGQTSVLVFYRGERSFFCRQWLRRWLTIPALERRLELADVVIMFTSSQSQGKAFSVADQIAGHHSLLDRRLFFFGDPEHLLVNYLIERTISKPIITNPDSHRAHGWVFDYGMVQPAIVAITSDSAVIYDWTSKPSILNVAGKLDRPDPWDVWDCIERRLDRIRISKARASRLVPLTPPDRPYTSRHPSHHPPHSPVFPLSATEFPYDTCPSPSTLVPVTKRLQSIPPNSPKLDFPTKVVRADASQRQHQYQHQHQHRHQHHYCNDESCHSNNHANPELVHSTNQGDTMAAPRSTSIDTLVYPGTNVTLLQEDLDISQTNLIADVRFHDISARISALANDLLAEETNNAYPTSTQPPQSDASNSLYDSAYANLSPQRGSNENGQAESYAYQECQSPNISDIVPSHQTHQNDIHDGKHHFGKDVDTHSVPDDNDAVDDADEDTHENEQFPTTSLHHSSGLNVISNTTTTTHIESDLEPLYTDDVKSEALKPDRRLDLFERQLSTAEPLETSVASAGSDQVDSTTVTMKHASIRTDDSSQLHSMQCDSASFSSDRRILEEADDCKPGVADHLCELKDVPLNPYLRNTRRGDADHSASVTASKGVDRSIPEPQTMLINTNSLEVTTMSASPYPPTSRSAHVDGSASHVQSHLVPNVSTDVSSSAGIENTMPLSTNLLENSVSALHDVQAKYRHGANSDTERPTDMLGSQNALAPLRDEYEAYDEYIVCEYQVEEHVEEFESDSISRSRGFMTTVMQEGGAPPRSSSLRDIHGGNLKDRGKKEKDTKVETNRPGGSALAAMSSAPTLSPGVEARVLEWRHSTGDSMGGSQMRRVLRKIKVPIMAVRRKVGGKGHHANHGEKISSSVRHDHVDAKTIGGVGETETCLGKKDVRRGMLRKRPPHLKAAGNISPSSALRQDNRHFRDSEGDEQSARIGRKETLRAVFRRIPMPKHRRRASTGEGAASPPAVASENKIRNDGDRHFDASAFPRKSNSSHSGNKGGTLQAVLQRIPSLSGTSREQRIGLIPELSYDNTKGEEPMKAVRISDDVLHRQVRKAQGNKVSLGRERAGPQSVINERPVLSAPVSNSELSGKRGEPLLPLRNFGGDVWVAGLDRASRGIGSSPQTPRQRSLEKAENDTARRLEFRTSTSRVTSGDDSESGDNAESVHEGNRTSNHCISKLISPRQRRIDPASYDSDDTDEWRRRQRTRQGDSNVNGGTVHGTYSEGQEKLGPKLSFALAGDQSKVEVHRKRM